VQGSVDARAGTLVTVVVPTRNSERTLERCLASVRAQAHAHVELIVVDNGSTDGTVAIASRYAHRVHHVGPERSAQRNAGARLGAGDVVAFIDSDMILDPDVLADAADRLARDDGLGAVIVDEIAFGTGALTSSRVLEKALCVGDASVEAARVFRREAFEQAGGFDERLYACEDWDLADRVSRLGWRTDRVAALIRHDEGRISLRQAFSKKRYYGRGAADWLRGPDAAARRGRPFALLAAIARSDAPRRARAGLALLKCVEWTGFALGVAEQRARAVRRRQTSR
jgi:arabinofuranan 3-O-arabinosyltransferase